NSTGGLGLRIDARLLFFAGAIVRGVAGRGIFWKHVTPAACKGSMENQQPVRFVSEFSSGTAKDRRMRINIAAVPGVVMWLGAALAAEEKATTEPSEKTKANAKVDFKTDVVPILQQNCVDCHGPEMQMAGLRLDQRRFAIEEGEPRGIITPG